MFSVNQEKELLDTLNNVNSFKAALFICNTFNFFADRTVALVTGGCIRSVMTGKPIKDIDIVLEMTKLDTEELSILARKLGYSMQCLSNSGYEELQECAVVYQLNKVGEVPIEVIMVRGSAYTRIAHHSTNCSKVWLDNGELQYYADYFDFITHKVVQYYTQSPLYSDKYQQRLKEYYPDYKHVMM